MTGRTHDLAAFTALTTAVILFPVGNISFATGITAIIANLIGGIAPDIDQPTAPFWRNLPIGGMVGRSLTRLLGGHRFLSHSLVGVFIFGYGFYYLLHILQPSFQNLNMDIIWQAFMIGFVSHLVMDTFTHEGVPWFLPIPIKLGVPPFRFLRMKTGGFIERFVLFPVLFLVCGALYYVNYEKIVEILKQNLK